MSTITAKFAKDLNKFFTWANENNYVIKNKENDSIINWSTEMLPDFSEPARNKIDAYIKELLKIYDLYDKNNIKIEDTYIKLVIKEFKDNKPTSKKVKKSEEPSDDIQNANREPKEQTEKLQTKRKYTRKTKTSEQTKSESNSESESDKKTSKKNTSKNEINNSESETSKTPKKLEKAPKKTTKSKNENKKSTEDINNFNIQIDKGIIKMISQNWFIETNDHVNISYVIEYIANNKDNIIAQIEKQRNTNNKQSTIPLLQSKIEIDESKLDESTIDDSFNIGSPDLGTITLDDIQF
jgi:flagellar biosynthesis GTPase FlhF